MNNVTGMGADKRATVSNLTAAKRLADAAITVIARDGLDALSVRVVAREAAVTGGAVQHHYPTKTALTVAALDRTVERQTARLARSAGASSSGVARPTPTPVVDRLIDDLCRLLPFDPPSREEAAVWIAMSAATVAEPAIAERHRRAVDRTRRWLTVTVDRARSNGEIASHADPDAIATMLEAALDGVMLQTVATNEDDRDDDAACSRLGLMVRRLVLVA